MKVNHELLQFMTHLEIFKVFEAGFKIAGTDNPLRCGKWRVVKENERTALYPEYGSRLEAHVEMQFAETHPEFLQFVGKIPYFNQLAAIGELIRLGVVEL